MTDTRKGPNPYDDMSKRTREHWPNLVLMIGGAVVAVIALIAALVFLWPSGGDGENAGEGTGASAAADPSQETAAVAISGEDLPPLPDTGGFLPAAGEDEAVGLTVPTLTGQSFDESEVVIDPDDGQPWPGLYAAQRGNCGTGGARVAQMTD